MTEVVNLAVTGMTCMGCAGSVKSALEEVEGVEAVEVTIDPGKATVTTGAGVSRSILISAVMASGFGIEGEASVGSDFNWGDTSVWKQSAHNTKWCLLGCSIGEFATLGAYSVFSIGASVVTGSPMYYLLLILPLINGLITSVMLETGILMRGQMDFSNALQTALGMSFISMLMMEIAMEITDLLFTGGELGMNPIAIPFMLVVGFLTPWPFNYWRLKKLGKACH